MKQSRQLSLLAVCTLAALGLGVASCGDESSGVYGKLNDACSASKPCADGFVCSDEGKCVEKTDDPKSDPAKLGEDCSAEKACDTGLECGAEGKCVEKTVDPGPGPGPVDDPCAMVRRVLPGVAMIANALRMMC